MKKLIVLAVFALMVRVGHAQMASAAPAAEAKPDFAMAEFDTQNFDFGKIKKDVPATHEFTFVNKGKVPLIITNAQPSCGCTIPAWTRDPIPPGGTGFVKATYNAAGLGNFDKSISVTANVEQGIIVLRIHGEVVPNQL